MLRFRPPRTTTTPELLWALLRAYAPVGSEAPHGSPDGRLAMARRLQLLTRIAARHSRETLIRELGQQAAEICRGSLLQQTAHGLAIVDMIRTCSELANSHHVDIVLLKFAALHRLGHVSVATRPVADLDLLLSEVQINEFCDAMTHSGASRLDNWEPGHHPAVFRTKSGKNAELHVCLPHVRVQANSRFADLDALREADLVESLPGDGSHVFVPRKALLLGHLVAHALVTHAFAPAAYPALRLLSDAIDLGLAADEYLVSASTRQIGADVPGEYVSSLAELARHASAGTLEGVITADSTFGTLMRHLLASTLNEGYRRNLRVRRLGQLVAEAGPLETLRHLRRWIRRSDTIQRG